MYKCTTDRMCEFKKMSGTCMSAYKCRFSSNATQKTAQEKYVQEVCSRCYYKCAKGGVCPISPSKCQMIAAIAHVR